LQFDEIDRDREFEEREITEVHALLHEDHGWSVHMDGVGVFVTSEHCAQAPVVGETIRLYGRGMGFEVRGIVIEGRVYRYETPEAMEARYAEERAEFARKREIEKPIIEAKMAERQAEGIPHPRTRQELYAYIDRMCENPGSEGVGYALAPDAAMRAAVATFNFLAHMHGLSGFQAGHASLRILAEIRSMKGPFGVVDGAELLWPDGEQSLADETAKWLADWKTSDWLRQEAARMLAEAEADPEAFVAPAVREHWQRIVGTSE